MPPLAKVQVNYPFPLSPMDACPGCGNEECTCGGDLSVDAPGAQEAAMPDGGGEEEGGDLGLL